MTISLWTENERICATVNKAWGEKVATVEERLFIFTDKITRQEVRMTIPVVTSKLICGKLPGRAEPPFFAGPTPSLGARR